LSWVLIFLGAVILIFILVVVVIAARDDGSSATGRAVRGGMLALDEFTNPAVEHIVEMEHDLEVLAEEDESGEGKAGGRRPEARGGGAEES